MESNAQIRNLLIATFILIIVIIILTLSPPKNKGELVGKITRSGLSANNSQGNLDGVHKYKEYNGILNLKTKFSFQYPSTWKIVSLEKPFYKNTTYSISLEDQNILTRLTVYPSCVAIPTVTSLKPYYVVNSKKIKTGGIEYLLYENDTIVAIFYYNNNISILLNYHKIVTNYFGSSIDKNTESEFNILVYSVKIIGGEYKCS